MSFRELGMRERGMTPFGILFIFIIIIILLFLLDQGFILKQKCQDVGFIECALDELLGDDEEEKAPEGSVTATGELSGEFNGEQHSVTIQMTFPLEGGKVTGSFSGDCDGNLSGEFAGGNGGAISGKGGGSCGFVIPASGNFSGSVNTSAKTVNITGTGSAAGFSKTGSMTLTY